MYTVTCYAVYLVITVSVTIWLAQTLHKSGRTFLVDAFHGNTELADSVNRLLVVGFYLINVGYITLEFSTSNPVLTTRAAIELVIDKIGWMLVILGIMHMVNIFALSRFRKRAHAGIPAGN